MAERKAVKLLPVALENRRIVNREVISQRIDLYAAAYPASPSAVCRPRVFHRSDTWIALLADGQEIIGYGDTIEAALRKFDARYLAALRRPVESAGQAA